MFANLSGEAEKLNMTSNIEELIRNPSEDLLNEFSKDQLLALASHYNVVLSVADKQLKENFKIVLDSCFDRTECS